MRPTMYYRLDPSVPWERLPSFRREIAKNPPLAAKGDPLNHRILLETIFKALSCGRDLFKTTYAESCEYAIGVLVDFYLDKNYEDAQLGAVALHVATMVQYGFEEERSSNCAETQRLFDKLLIKRKDQIRNTLILLPRCYPKAAQVCLSNGRLPLHWALEAGKTWNEENHYDIAIQVLMKAYPNGVTMIDPVTGLAPFMMAAAKNDQSSAVNTTFRLLQMDLTVVLEYTSDLDHTRV